MAELFTRKWQSEGRMVGRYVYSPVGYTEDDVRRLAHETRGCAEFLHDQGDTDGARSLSNALAPFRALLDGGDRAKA